jgi:transcriptional regulator of acetoin/glycerol metabolism
MGPNTPTVDIPRRPTRAFEDEVLKREIESAARSLAIGLPVIIDGETGTGKSELARRIHDEAFDDSSLAVIDCRLLTADNFESYLFGDEGMIGFFDPEPGTNSKGKLPLARGGSVLFRNAQTLDKAIQSRISDVMTFEDERRRNGITPVITGWLFVGPASWMDDPEFDIAPAFSNSIDGKTVTAPPLSQRSDFKKVALAIIADISQEHSLSPVALSILQEESCVMIKRSWKETGGNVSLVARRLGVSRNTVYKHVREA